MGPKRKDTKEHTKQSTKEPTKEASKPSPDVLIKLKSSSGTQFEVPESSIAKCSPRMKKMVDDLKGDHTLELDFVDEITLSFIAEFIKAPRQSREKISYPLKSNLKVKDVMSEEDALILEKVQELYGDGGVRKLLDASSQLGIQELKEKLCCLVAFKLMRHAVFELREMYGIPEIKIDEGALKEETKEYLKDLGNQTAMEQE